MAAAKQRPPIKVISYVERKNGEKVLVSDLTPEERRRLAEQITVTGLGTYLNACMREKYPGIKITVKCERIPQDSGRKPSINII